MAIRLGAFNENAGLQFGFDIGGIDAVPEVQSKGWKGQPGTNLFEVQDAQLEYSADTEVSFPVQDGNVPNFKRVASNTVIGGYKVKPTDVVYRYDLGDNGCHYHGNDSTAVNNGDVVSLSLEYLITDNVEIVSNYLGNFEQLAGVSGTWGSVDSETNKWHEVRLSRTSTGADGANLRMLMYPGGCSSSRLAATGSIYYKNPTVTVSPKPVPFYSGSRATTDALIDLSDNNHSIDLSSVSYNSTYGYPTFDGTDDKITITNTDSISLKQDAPWTLEIVYKVNSFANTYPGVFKKGTASSSTGAIIFYTSGGATYWKHNNVQSLLGTLTFGDTHHIIISHPGSGGPRLYVNGEKLSYNATDMAGEITSNWEIGRADHYGNHDIYQFKVYDVVFSDARAKRHYNGIKNKYNIE